MQCWPEVSPAAGRSPPSLNPLAFLAVTRIDPAEQPARQIRSCADAARTCRMMALCFNGVQKDRALPGKRPPMKPTRWGSKIRRAPCRDRGWWEVSVSEGAVSLKKKIQQ